MDGRQFREEQVRDHELGSIPTVVLTAGGITSPPVPVDEILEKPVSLDGLLHTIERHCAPGHPHH
jgi:hypothetical protein